MQKYSYFYCILAIFIFSTNELVGKFIDSAVSPLAITCYRFFIGSLLLSCIYFRKHIFLLNKTRTIDIAKISLIGILIGFSMYLLQLGVYYSQASFSAIIISTNPIFVSILAVFILKEKLSTRTILCLLFGLMGLSLVIFGQTQQFETSENLFLGIIYCILASITFALYTVLSKNEIKKTNNFFFNAISFLSGAVGLFIFGLLTKQDMSIPLQINHLLGLIYLGVFVTGIAYITFFHGLKHIKAAYGSSFFLLKPIFASIMAYFLLKEQLVVIQIIGVGIVIISLLLQHTSTSSS